MPKAKKRGRGSNKNDKEKPLLSVQGILRLDKSFVPRRDEDAQVIQVRRCENGELETIKLVPGQSEHEMVQYKAGYDVGPSNPFPQNEPERVLFEEMEKVRQREEAFEEMKKQSEEERKEREKAFAQPLGRNEETTEEEQPDPDDPNSYHPPEHIKRDPAFHNDKPLEFGVSGVMVLPPGDEMAAAEAMAEEAAARKAASTAAMAPMIKKPPDARGLAPVESEESAGTEGTEEQVLPEDQLPQMKPLPQEPSKPDYASLHEMALSVALAAEAERGRLEETPKPVALDASDEEDDEMVFSLDELAHMNAKEDLQPVQGPQLSVEHIQESAPDQDYQEQARKVLAAYWDFVLKNPYDFNGWTYLLQQAEHLDDVTEVRKAYKDFLEKYPYCYAYWQRYSEFEQRHNNWERALTLLRLAVTNIPLSGELWLAYLELYHKLYSSSDDFDTAFRAQCEWAIESVGLDYKSDPVWERYIGWELERKNLVWISGIYRRLIAIPTRLYNKHWDNFIAHVRDHHPRDILEYDEYERLRKVTCGELGLTYRPDPVVGEPAKPRQVVQPEDKLKVGMKERIVACVVTDHEKCEEEVDKRFRFEEKIKRPYYHVKPLDLKQLKNWEAYLEFEIGEGDHERIVVLFERCLVACANYEQFWVKYARYLERHHSAEARSGESGDRPAAGKISTSALKKARWHFGTGLTTVDELREKRCTWTLRGWKETDKDGNEVMVAEEIPAVQAQERSAEGAESEKNAVPAESNGSEEARSESEGAVAATTPSEPSEATKWQDVVRNVYSRACVTHCPKRANVKMRWAAFEEEVGDLEKSKAILTDLLGSFPLLLECRLQLIDVERRCGNLDAAEKLYEDLVKLIPKNRLSIRTWVSMKLARFQFKVRGQPEKAVKTLKLAWKRDPSEPKLYALFIEICYQRQPVNVDGIIMAIDQLALKSDSLSSRQKLEFVKRKVEFMQEYGSIGQLREAGDQLKAFRLLCAGDLKEEARARKEREREREELGQLDAAKAHVRADAALKAKQAEAEGRLFCTQCQTAMLPDADGVYEFERLRARPHGGGEAITAQPDEDGVVDLLDLVIPEDQEEQIRKTLEEKTKYKEVAPTWELNMETYGYSKRRKVYDPDYEHVENAKFREYERLEGGGYDDDLRDADHDKPRNISAPGLGADQLGPESSRPGRFTTSDYIVPPKVPQMLQGLNAPRNARSAQDLEKKEELAAFELPPEIANPQTSPCVNVPEWFVKEGGELSLSDTASGKSVLRYWPKFLSEKGNHHMFNRLRKYCKWHQKQVKIGGEWKYETRLVAWYGPCDFEHSGLTLEKNSNWAPELLDLLDRLKSTTREEFNSCLLNLYRHGHDMCTWCSLQHVQMGRSPPVAFVTVGAVRVLELRKKAGAPNFIRFPLFPGSLLLMTGATQDDWLHSVPRDPICKEETICLTFRIMYSINRRISQ